MRLPRNYENGEIKGEFLKLQVLVVESTRGICYKQTTEIEIVSAMLASF